MAFAAKDFGSVYDSYHPDSNFCRQFPDRQAYIEYAETALSSDFDLDQCRILRERVEAESARVIYYLDFRFRGERSENFELALLLLTGEGWRIHSSQKLTREEYVGEVDAIDWDDFERSPEKFIF